MDDQLCDKFNYKVYTALKKKKTRVLKFSLYFGWPCFSSQCMVKFYISVLIINITHKFLNCKKNKWHFLFQYFYTRNQQYKYMLY